MGKKTNKLNPYHPGFFKKIKYFNNISGDEVSSPMVCYGGTENLTTPDGKLLSWLNLETIL